MTHSRDSLLHPIHGVAAEDIAAELGHSTGARIGALERMVDRILRYLVLRIRAFRGIQILTGPDAGALVTPDGNGVIGIECQSETGTIQAVEGTPHRMSICPPAGGGGGCASAYSLISLYTMESGGMLPEGQCVAVGCDKEIILRLGECLTGNISCDPDGNATIDIGINFGCICEKCGTPGGGPG